MAQQHQHQHQHQHQLQGSEVLHAAIDEMDALATRLEELLRRQDVADQEATAELPFSGWMEGDSLAPPCPSTLEVCDIMLAAADLGPSDVLIDLGAGDGRVCLRAATKFGVRAMGVEIEAGECDKFQSMVDAMGIGGRESVRSGDVRQVRQERVSEHAESRVTPWQDSEILVTRQRASPHVRIDHSYGLRGAILDDALLVYCGSARHQGL